jgi:hypothetical protein
MAAFAGDQSPDARREGKQGLCSFANLYSTDSEFERKCQVANQPEQFTVTSVRSHTLCITCFQGALLDVHFRKVIEIVAQGRTQGVETFGSSDRNGRWKGTAKRGGAVREKPAESNGMFRVDGKGAAMNASK